MKAKLDLAKLEVGAFYKMRSKSFIVVEKTQIDLPRRPHLGELFSRPIQTITVFYVSHHLSNLHQKLKTYSLGASVMNPDGTCYLTFS